MSFIRNSQSIARLSSELHVRQLLLLFGAYVPRRRSVLVHRSPLAFDSWDDRSGRAHWGALFRHLALVAVLLLVWAKFGQ
jgi:hypothetical protein